MRDEHGADDEHHGHHPVAAADEGLLAAEAVDADEQEDGRGDNLDGAVDAGREERAVRRRHADRLEDLGGVVADGVGAAELLPKHDAEGEEEALADAGEEDLAPGDALGGVELLFDGRPDLGHFLHNHGVVDVFGADVGEGGDGLLMSTLLTEPTWTLLEKAESDEHQATGDQLDADGDAPLTSAGGDAKGDAVVEPVGERRTDDQELLEETGNPSPNLGRRVLRDVDRHDGAHASDTQTGDDAAAVDLADGVRRARLHRRADHEDGAEAHESGFAAVLFVDEGGGDGAEEAAGGEEGDDVGADGGVLGVGEAALAGGQVEVEFEGVEGEDGAHHAGVVAWSLSSVCCRA